MSGPTATPFGFPHLLDPPPCRATALPSGRWSLFLLRSAHSLLALLCEGLLLPVRRVPATMVFMGVAEEGFEEQEQEQEVSSRIPGWSWSWSNRRQRAACQRFLCCALFLIHVRGGIVYYYFLCSQRRERNEVKDIPAYT